MARDTRGRSSVIRLLLAALVVVASALAIGCGDDDDSSDGYTPGSAIQQKQEEVSAQLQQQTALFTCSLRAVPDADCDGDTVINVYDRWIGGDDNTLDSDGDGYADWNDTFFGNNNGDLDADGLPNGYDPQPYAAPPSGMAVVPSSDAEYKDAYATLLAIQTERIQLTTDWIVDADGDADDDGTVNAEDSTPTPYDNDFDGDNDPDAFDPEPSNDYIDSHNDSYDPSNEEYWEQG